MPQEKEYRVTISIEQRQEGRFRPQAVAVFQSGRSFRTQELALKDAAFSSREAAVDYAMEQARVTLGKLNPRASIRFQVKDAG